MKAAIEVANRKEAEAIKAGLDDPATRAFVIIMGALTPLSERARKRVLQFASDHFDEHQQAKAEGQ